MKNVLEYLEKTASVKHDQPGSGDGRPICKLGTACRNITANRNRSCKAR